MQKRIVLLVILIILFLVIGTFVVNKLFLKMIYPVKGNISSKFGNRIHPVTGEAQFHNGIDIAASEGTPIFAPANGTIEKIYSNSTGGNQMILKHSNGFKTGYAHLSKYNVKEGDHVKQGYKIGEVGSTGRVTGAHLHLTMRDVSGELVDPTKYLS